MSLSENQPELHLAWRALDANLNRTSEALRTIEDVLRFVVEDANLSRVCKTLRHELKAVADQWPREHLLAMRDASGDVGRHADIVEEYRRTGIADILSANFARAGQSLRVLEEFSKLVVAETAVPIERLRYALYDLEKAALITLTSQQRLAAVRLYVLADGRQSAEEFDQLVTQLIDGGVDAIQLRDKSLNDRELVSRASRLVELTRAHGVLAIINDRPDVAVAAKADGVHLGQDDLTIALARQITGPHFLVGISTHSLEQARHAQRAGADYIGVGPVFSSGTKKFASLAGPELLYAVAADIRLPAFAIGGITLDNMDQVLAAGFTRVAVSGAIVNDRSRSQDAARSFKMRLASERSQVDST